jgi:hypothetical protein
MTSIDQAFEALDAAYFWAGVMTFLDKFSPATSGLSVSTATGSVEVFEQDPGFRDMGMPDSPGAAASRLCSFGNKLGWQDGQQAAIINALLDLTAFRCPRCGIYQREDMPRNDAFLTNWYVPANTLSTDSNGYGEYTICGTCADEINQGLPVGPRPQPKPLIDDRGPLHDLLWQSFEKLRDCLKSPVTTIIDHPGNLAEKLACERVNLKRVCQQYEGRINGLLELIKRLLEINLQWDGLEAKRRAQVEQMKRDAAPLNYAETQSLKKEVERLSNLLQTSEAACDKLTSEVQSLKKQLETSWLAGEKLTKIAVGYKDELDTVKATLKQTPMPWTLMERREAVREDLVVAVRDLKQNGCYRPTEAERAATGLPEKIVDNAQLARIFTLLDAIDMCGDGETSTGSQPE